MTDTLGLFHEAMQLARDLGYDVREEALGDLPGGLCTVNGKPQVRLNLERPVSERLDRLVQALAGDPRVAVEPKSRLLEARLQSAVRSSG